jgi:tetratricopeptide (TPR) repeat protein
MSTSPALLNRIKRIKSIKRLTVLSLAITAIGACSVMPFLPDSKATAPVLDGFGDSTLIPSQASPAAQRLFAQGMAQVYAFNETEAIRAFKAALAQDANCAMCAWGVAYQMGPSINSPSRGDLTEAVKYVDYALKHSAGSSARDQALIDSLALRYAHSSLKRELTPLLGEICAVKGGSNKRADPLDIAYAERMHDLVKRFPNDPDILSIYAEAEMVATTEDWWDKKTGNANGKMGEVADLIEAALHIHPKHTGLNHYMIHSVDDVHVANRAVPAADRLGQLAPKSPHLLHMPSHTYAQVGRYADATRVNQLAVAADEAMFAELRKQNFSISKDWRGHNRHFQWYGAIMDGRGDLAIETARAAAKQAQGDHTYFEYVRSLPILSLMYLQRWDAIEKEALPKGEQGVAISLGEMAKGTALARTGKITEAKAALTRLQTAATTLLKKNLGSGYTSNMVKNLVQTAQFQLTAEIAFAENRTDDALSFQSKAAKAAAAVDDSEPPMLAGATLRRLAQMQAQSKRYPAAEQSYREDLKIHPNNGWALQGLTNALQAQGKQSEAQTTKAELERNWKNADAQLRGLN